MVGDVKVALADPLVGLRVVEQRHELPFVSLVAHQRHGVNVFVVLKLELELQHFLGVDLHDGAGALVEHVGDVVGVRLVAVREVRLVRRDKFGDVHGLGRLDDLDGAGREFKAHGFAAVAAAGGDDLKRVAVDSGFVLGHDAQRFGGIFAGVFVRGDGVGDGAVGAAGGVDPGDRDVHISAADRRVARYIDGRRRHGGRCKDRELGGGKADFADGLAEAGSLVGEFHLGGEVSCRGVGAVDIRRKTQLAARLAAGQAKALVVACVAGVVKVKALSRKRSGDDIKAVGIVEPELLHHQILVLPVVADVVADGEVHKGVVGADVAGRFNAGFGRIKDIKARVNKLGTVLKGGVVEGHLLSGGLQGGKACAALKGVVADGFKVVGAFDLHQIGAVLERPAADRGDRLRQLLIVQTRLLKDAGIHLIDGLGDHNVLQHIAAEEAELGQLADACADFDRT